MVAYLYKAVDSTGKQQTGSSEAETPEALAELLKTKGLFVMESRLQTPRRSSPPPPTLAHVMKGVSLKDAPVKSVPLDAVAIFTSEFAIMLRSGLPLNEALQTLVRQQKHPGFKRVLLEISRKIQEGQTLSETFALFPAAFDSIYLALLSAGEVSGNIPSMLERLSAYLAFRRDLRSKVKSALLYPSMILLTGIAVALFLVIFILPNFATMFTQMDIVLPLPTRILLGVSAHLRHLWWGYVLALTGLALWVRRWLKAPAHTLALERFELRLPIIGPLVRNIVMTRILRTLGALVASGVPILESLRLAGEAASHMLFHNILKRVATSASEGNGLATTLANDPFFPPMAADMIANAEVTGTLPLVMTQISDYYEKETDLSIRNVFAVMEPLFVIIIGLMVGSVAVSILLPIFKLNGAIG